MLPQMGFRCLVHRTRDFAIKPVVEFCGTLTTAKDHRPTTAMLRLLCITAHPDDEAGGFGGSLLVSAERGIETHVLCLTPGQAASHRGNSTSDDELAAMRRREFAASCAILKVTRGEVLDYRDGALDRADFYSIVADLACRIRQLRPQVLMTFGPEGAVTAHPDHSMASIFATAAYHWAGRPDRFREQLSDGLRPYRVQKLYYATAAFTLPDRPPISLPPTTTTIDIGDYCERKISAFKAHTTQAPLFARVEDAFRKRGRYERFHLVATITPQNIEPETDLFTGVVEDTG
jgi:LmbE family N-acetylglucosaminyl deacetylase